MADDAGAAGDAAGAVKPVRVFVSYSHDSQEHKDRVLALVDRLREDGITCFFDQDAAYRPEGWPQWCLNCIEAADFVLIVCTENYYNRFRGKTADGVGNGVKYEGYVINQAIYDDGTKNDKFFPVLFAASDVTSIPEPIRGTTRYILSDEGKYWSLYALLTGQHPTPATPQGTRKTIPRAQRQPLFPAANAPSPSRPWFVPHAKNPFFTGRQDELDALHAALHGGGRAAICQAISGLGGIGKTQTAVRYCYDRRDDYAAIFWLRAQSPDTLAADVAAVARELGLPEARAGDQAITTRAVQQWLRTQTGWLLVLDNVDTEAMRDVCRDFLPTGLRGGAVLITSRLEDLTELNIAAPLRLPVLPEEEAIAFLLRRTGREHPNQAELAAVRLLARDLGRLPLALEQAAAYCKAGRLSFAAYRTRFKEAGVALLDKARVRAGTYEKTIATTWQLSIAEVARECPAAVTVLQVCSMLAAEAIPLEVIHEGGSEMGPDVATVIEEDGVEAVLASLAKYSLIDWEDGSEDFSMHRLVQCVTREDMGDAVRKVRAEMAVLALDAAFPDVEFVNWPLCERLTPHALVCHEWIDTYAMTTEKAARFCNNAGGYLTDRARYTEVEPLQRSSLKIAEIVLGFEHQHVATILNNIAALLKIQGKPGEAEPLIRRALAIREKALGPEHPDVAISLNNLATLLQDQGKPGEAELLFRRALAIWKKKPGPEQPDVAYVFNNLAMLLRDKGKLGEAEPLFHCALAILEKTRGPEHPDVAISLNNFAGLLEDQGKPDEAEPLYRRALDIREKVLVPEHPAIASSLNNIAMLLENQGKPDEAEPLYQRALAILEKAHGPDHPHVATVLENLAILLQHTNRADEAAPLLARAKAIRKAHALRNNLPYDEDDG